MLSSQSTNLDIKGKSATITWIKAAAVLSVVFYHSVEQYISMLSSPNIVVYTLSILLKAMGVPIFFFIPGFLCHKQSITGYYKKRLSRLLSRFCSFQD